MALWPPTLEDLQVDMKLADVTLTDAQTAELEQTLASAAAYVERVRSDVDFAVEIDDDLYLGTLRLARRWDLRRESPVGMIVLDGITSANIPGWDSDIERQLQIGRYARMRFA